MEKKDPFINLKEICDAACHERKACVKGYKQMLASNNVEQMMQTWRDNWQDVVDSKYADIIRSELPKIYSELKKEMNRAGIYLNECPENAQRYVNIIITDTDDAVNIYGMAKAYVLGIADVIAHDNTQVYNLRMDANITLLDYSYGHINAGKVTAKGRSSLTCSCDAIIDGAVQCSATGGTVIAKCFRELMAYGDSLIRSHMTAGITLHDKAQFEYLKNNE